MYLMRPSAVLFDMDGTLTRPMLDFAAIRAEMGIGEQPILEALEKMPPRRRRAALAILLRHERHAAEKSTLNPGCARLLRWLQSRNIPLAVITRNSRRSAHIVLSQHGLKIDALVTRDDGVIKPQAAPLLLACRRLKAAASEAWMVGDGQYDVEAGLAAGMKTVWISHGKRRRFAARPWRSVADLKQLHNLLRRCVSD